MMSHTTRQRVYHNRYQQVFRVETAVGRQRKEYFVTDYGQRAGLIVTKGNSVLLVRQYRLLLDGRSWEIPGGAVEEGETAAQAAARECLEETGIQCRQVRRLAVFQPGLDTLHNPTHVFFSDTFDDLSHGLAYRSVRGQCQWVPLARCIAMVFGQRIVDSLSIIALLSYQHKRGELSGGRLRRASQERR